MIRHTYLACLLHLMSENAAIQPHAPGWSPADRPFFRAGGSFAFT